MMFPQEKKYFIMKKHPNNVFCNSYWNFLLKNNIENKGVECYVKNRIRAKWEYSSISTGEELTFTVTIKISTETYLKINTAKEKYTFQVIYRDSFLRHCNAIDNLQSNLVSFYY